MPEKMCSQSNECVRAQLAALLQFIFMRFLCNTAPNSLINEREKIDLYFQFERVADGANSVKITGDPKIL